MEIMNMQLGMGIKGYSNLRKVIKRNLDGELSNILFVAASPSGEDREVWSHSVFGLLDGPVSVNERDEVIPIGD